MLFATQAKKLTIENLGIDFREIEEGIIKECSQGRNTYEFSATVKSVQAFDILASYFEERGYKFVLINSSRILSDEWAGRVEIQW